MGPAFDAMEQGLRIVKDLRGKLKEARILIKNLIAAIEVDKKASLLKEKCATAHQLGALVLVGKDWLKQGERDEESKNGKGKSHDT